MSARQGAWRGAWDELVEGPGGLSTGEIIECQDCQARYDRADVETWESGDDPLGCPACGCEGWMRGFLFREQKDKKVAARWGDDVAACGFVVKPNVLLEHSPALGLSALDLQLLDLLELHRRESAQAWPSEALLAELAGVSVSQVGRRLRRLRDRGLIEWTRERGHGGRWEHRVYTRHGLERVCQLLAANRRAPDHPDLPAQERRVRERAGLADLLGELRDHRASVRGGDHSASVRGGDHSASVRGGEHENVRETPENGATTAHQCSDPPRTGAVDHRASVTDEIEAVEAEAEEADSANAAASFDADEWDRMSYEERTRAFVQLQRGER